MGAPRSLSCERPPSARGRRCWWRQRPGESAATLGLTGEEVISIDGLAQAMSHGGAPPRELTVRARPHAGDGRPIEFDARVRIDTPREAEYFRHGGILPYVLRRLLA